MSKPIVLLVDDQPANLFALEAMLTRHDLTIVTAGSGKEALELLLVHDVALAILDVQMPEMDGFELATLMRGVARTSRVPIIFVTAANSDQSRVFQGYEAGAVDFLFKPIEITVLRSKVDVFVTLEKQRRALEASLEAGRQAERLRELFIGILGHDLRNPLGAMLTSTQLVMKRTTDEHLKKPLERVLRSGERMVRMIEQLLDVTRIRLGEGVVLCPAQVDLSSLVDQVLVGAPAGKERFEVETLGDPRGHWDADRLFQVVANLAGNAGQHSPSGPIHVRIDGRASDHVELRIHNDGPPVPPEVREAMFEPFQRVDEPHKRNRGLGLGLYISKQFVQAHGGSISMESSEGHGTAFNVSLPRHEEAALHAPP